MSLPLDNPERPRLRERVPFSQKKLDQMTRKFLTLAPEFKPNPIPIDQRPLPKDPIYPAWCRGTRQLPCRPFESGSNTLPGLDHLA
jgi:hypothetical protein